jgi:hypothetical protein
MAHAHSTLSVKISRGLRITHAIALALFHALHVTVIRVSSLRALYVRIHTSITFNVEFLYSVNGVCSICKDLYELCPLSDPRTTSGNGCVIPLSLVDSHARTLPATIRTTLHISALQRKEIY